MDDTTIVAESVGIVEERARARSAVSWSAVIAGAIAALAVTFIVISLGSGIGLAVASPFSYSSPSAETLTILGALWLVFAQAIGYATGGYLAGRLRTNPAAVHTTEVKFRDGANGLIVWALGVAVSLLVVAGTFASIGKAATEATATVTAAASGNASSVDYFADTLLRADPQKPPPANAAATRDQVKRIIVTSTAQGGLAPDDRTYLAQIVASETGMAQDDAQRRVDDAVGKARASLTQAADKARKAGAFFSFWTFMSLLFGAACATLGGILGGDLRDAWAAYKVSPATAG